MSLQTGALEKQPYFPLTQQIWHQAWHSEDNHSMQSLCAKIACIVFPIISAIALVEGILLAGRKVCHLFAEQNEIKAADNVVPPLDPRPRPAQAVTTLDLLVGSSQYDIVNNAKDLKNQRPPACTFHALTAASDIAFEFEKWANAIEHQEIQTLSDMQRKIIENGTGAYFWGVTEIEDRLIGGADLDDIRSKWPEFLVRRHLHLEDTDQDPQAVDVRTQAIVECLFDGPEGRRTNIAWIKNGNDESFSVICNKDRAIVFDSHKNYISLIRGKEQARAFLTEKLAPFAQMIDGMDVNAFSYAVGFFVS